MYRSAPRGQAIIVVAASMVVLLGIAAIVIDLGMSWMLRRQEQNAADPASIAAARYIEDGDYNAMKTAACFYVQENGFFEDDPDCAAALDPANKNLEVLWPPSGHHAGQYAGNSGTVLVVVRERHPSLFGRIFGQSEATVATGAVAARETKSANSNSLVALDPTSCAAGRVHGGGDITIEPVENPATPGIPYSGGYVHVNSECASGAFNDTCASGSGAFHHAGSGGAQLTAPHIYIHGTCQVSGGTVNSPVTEGAPQIGDPLAGLRGPRQGDYPGGYCPRKVGSTIVYEESLPTDPDGCPFNANGMTADLVPGVYYGGWDFRGNNVTLRLQPGTYIIAGGGIKITGSATVTSIGADPTTDPARVLIYSTDNTEDPACTEDQDRCVQGSISLAGNASLKVWGLDSGPWKGLLMWQDGQGTNPDEPISLTGGGDMNIAGTIYAPKALVNLEGNGSSTARLAVQVISWRWDVGGTADLYMPYDPSELYHITQRGLVH
ncbi:MAG: pilus assembly protein TadG-related protein [Chloroflexota bacterium]|nr:pilus assembly protein TadG-related protein [Chloroflexota bacterium]